MKSIQLKTGILVLGSLFFFLNIQAQELKKVINKPTGTYYFEEYQVLQSDKKIKHGSYAKISYNKEALETGFYKNNLRDSTWTEYYNNSTALRSRGNYRNNERTGIWEFYTLNGLLDQKYDFTQKKLIFINLRGR